VPNTEPARQVLPYASSVTEADRAGADERYERVRARFAEGTESLMGMEVSDRAFVDHLLDSLLLDFDADVEGIAGSQWFPVSVLAYRADAPILIEVGCDSQVDGLVTIWQWLDDRATRRPERPMPESIAGVARCARQMRMT